MDFLKSAAIPQSVEHFHVLIVIAGLISIVMYPYIGFLLGSSILSFFFNKKGTRENNRPLVAFARDLIETALYNKTVPTFFALLPSFSLIFVYAQLLQATDAMSVGLAGYGFLLLLIAIALLYTYKYTFHLGGILDGYEGLLKSHRERGDGLEQIHEYSKETLRSHYVTGKYGIAFLAVASFLLVSATSVAANPSNWTELDTVFDLFLSFDVLIRVFQFIAIGLGATGIGILYFFFAWQRGSDTPTAEYDSFARKIAVRFAVISLIAQPLLILVSVLLLPDASLSGSLYGFAGLALIMLFLTAHFVYAYVRDSQKRHVSLAFYSLFVTFALLGANDQIAIHNATAEQAAILAYRSDLAVDDLKAKLGVATVMMTGEDIYNGRCSACHLFDEKKIGPAYKDVIPTFHGDKAKIIAFVLNPYKVDKAFPPMPNQGLRPAEADSIVSYILRRLGTSETKPVQPGPQK